MKGNRNTLDLNPIPFGNYWKYRIQTDQFPLGVGVFHQVFEDTVQFYNELCCNLLKNL